MKDTTRKMREELNIDIRRMRQHNNSKTPEQNRQSEIDRANYYYEKWAVRKPETPAQKNYITAMLNVCYAVFDRYGA